MFAFGDRHLGRHPVPEGRPRRVRQRPALAGNTQNLPFTKMMIIFLAPPGKSAI